MPNGRELYETKITMKRRDFLFLTHAGDDCARLSCQQLYMHYRDLTRTESHGADASGELAEWWAGEPESEFALESPESFFRRLGEALHGKRRLELADKEWLGDAGLRRRVEHLLSGFRAAGGEVVLAPKAETAESVI